MQSMYYIGISWNHERLCNSQMKFKMANAKDEDFPALSERQIEKLRKELRERLSHEEVERPWRLEALDGIFTASMVDEQSFINSG